MKKKLVFHKFNIYFDSDKKQKRTLILVTSGQLTKASTKIAYKGATFSVKLITHVLHPYRVIKGKIKNLRYMQGYGPADAKETLSVILTIVPQPFV